MMKPRAEKPAKETSSEEAADYQRITPPADYSPPDDKQEGDTFDATVRFRVEKAKKKGRIKLCVLTIDGVPMKEDEEYPEPEPAAPATLQDAVSAHREAGAQF